MKILKVVLSIYVILLMNISVKSQTIPNGDFENWTNKNLFEEPAIYTTSNSQAFSQMSKIPISKSTDKVSGNYSVKIQTVEGMNEPIPGFLIIGTPGNQTINGGIPVLGRPDSISFFAKFNEMVGDTGAFVTFFKRNDTIIAMSRFTFIGSQSIFKKYSMPIYWFQSGNADTMAVIITSSNFDSEKIVGSTIYIDSVKFVGYGGLFPNGNFENWNSISSFDPENWFSLNFMTVGKPMVTRSTDKYSGNYSIKIENVMMNFGNIMGFITNGRVEESEYPTGGMAVNQNPLKVTGYYKYIPNGPDTAIAGIFLYRWDKTGDTAILIEDKIIKLKPTNSFTYFEIPILYNGKPKADTINIAFAASNIDDTAAYMGLGSILHIDKLNIEYKPNAISKISNGDLTVYPNPATDYFTIKISEMNNNYSELQIEIYDINGKLKLKTDILSKEIEVKKENMGAGVYFYKIKTNNNVEIYQGKILVK